MREEEGVWFCVMRLTCNTVAMTLLFTMPSMACRISSSIRQWQNMIMPEVFS